MNVKSREFHVIFHLLSFPSSCSNKFAMRSGIKGSWLLFPSLHYMSLCRLPVESLISLGLKGFPSGSDNKDLPAMQETQLWTLGWEDALEKGLETHSSILAWRIPWTEELQFSSVQLLSRVRLFVTPWTIAPTGSSVHGILQARILERVAIPFSRGSSRPRDQTLSPVSSIFDRQIPYHCATWEAPRDLMQTNK